MSEKLKTQIKSKFNKKSFKKVIKTLKKCQRRRGESEELLAGQGVSNTGAIVLALRD
jgi:hypothetical protein